MYCGYILRERQMSHITRSIPIRMQNALLSNKKKNAHNAERFRNGCFSLRRREEYGTHAQVARNLR